MIPVIKAATGLLVLLWSLPLWDAGALHGTPEPPPRPIRLTQAAPVHQYRALSIGPQESAQEVKKIFTKHQAKIANCIASGQVEELGRQSQGFRLVSFWDASGRLQRLEWHPEAVQKDIQTCMTKLTQGWKVSRWHWQSLRFTLDLKF